MFAAVIKQYAHLIRARLEREGEGERWSFHGGMSRCWMVRQGELGKEKVSWWEVQGEEDCCNVFPHQAKRKAGIQQRFSDMAWSLVAFGKA